MISSLQYSGGGAATKCNEDVYQLPFFLYPDTGTESGDRIDPVHTTHLLAVHEARGLGEPDAATTPVTDRSCRGG